MPDNPSFGAGTGEKALTTTSRSKSAPGPYCPPPDALVRTLPEIITYSGRVWWNEWIGEPFLGHKKASNGGAKGWVRRMFVAEWWLDNMPDVKISDKDKVWYFDGTKIGDQVYSYLNNNSNRGTHGRDPTAKPGEPVIKLRDRGEYHWRRANPAKYDEAVLGWKQAHNGAEPNFGQLGGICSAAFKALPPAEQVEWDAVAKAAVKASQAHVQLPTSLQRSQYYHKHFSKNIDDTLRKGDSEANIWFIGAIVHEKPDGTLKIDRKFSDSLKAFSNNPAVSNLLHVLGEWLEHNDGGSVESTIPAATVYPNYSKQNYPTLPNYVGWTLDPLQGLVRGMIKGIWVFQGAACRIKWTEIGANLEKFIDPERILPILLANWVDPSKYSLKIASIWAEFLLACQNGDIPGAKKFQFTIIPGGSNPIHPSESQEDSRELVERDGKMVWMLTFTRTVDKCHHEGGLEGMLSFYPKQAIAFADHIRSGQVHAHATSAPPRSWLGLPSANSSIPESVICPAELEFWRDLAKSLPDPLKDRVNLLLDRTNTHQYHLPAMDPKGIYKSKKAVPILVPSSPQPSALPHTMYPPAPMCQRNPPPNATVGYYEEWFEDLLDEGILLHEPSGTLCGGDSGVVGVSRSLLVLLFTFAVARRDFDPPEAPPASHTLSRLPLQDWDLLLGWIDRLSEAIDKSTEILAQTSAERKGGLNHLHSIPSNDATADEPSREDEDGSRSNLGPVASGSQALGSLPKPKPKPRKKRATAKHKKGKERAVSDEEASEAGLESESGGEEQDYEELDKTQQDDESEGSWLAGEGSFSYLPPNILAAHAHPRKPRDDSDTDPLELERRYGFPGVESGEPGDYEGEFPTEWARSDEVFGKFDDLPAYEPLHFHTPNALILHIEDIARSCEGALADFNKFLDLNPRAPPHIHKTARAKAQDYPRHQILYEYIFLRRGIWYDSARVAVGGIFSHGKHIALISREANKAQLMAHNTVQMKEFPDPNVGPIHLAQAIRSLNLATFEALWTLQELKLFQAHATKWYNKLEGNWLHSDVPSDLPTLVQVVKGLIDWCDETMVMIESCRTKRRVFWEKHLGQPFDQKHELSGMIYRFGCPSVQEELDGLREAFTRAKALLVNDATLASDKGGSEPQAEEGQDMPDSTGNSTNQAPEKPVADTGEKFMTPEVLLTTSTSTAPDTITSAEPDPHEKSASESAVTSEKRDTTPPTTNRSAPSAPSSPKSPIYLPAPTEKSSNNKRKRTEEPLESNQRRSSKRLSAAALTSESNLPKTRSVVARASESNAKSESTNKKKGDKNGKIASVKNGSSKRSRK